MSEYQAVLLKSGGEVGIWYCAEYLHALHAKPEGQQVPDGGENVKAGSPKGPAGASLLEQAGDPKS